MQCSVFGPDVFIVRTPLTFLSFGSSMEFILKQDHPKPAFTNQIDSNRVKSRRKVRETINEEGEVEEEIVKWKLSQ